MKRVFVEHDGLWYECRFSGLLTWKGGLVLRCGRCLTGRVKPRVGAKCWRS